jgi:hypothetical protein
MNKIHKTNLAGDHIGWEKQFYNGSKLHQQNNNVPDLALQEISGILNIVRCCYLNVLYLLMKFYNHFGHYIQYSGPRNQESHFPCGHQ